jgi:hypothetical protein
VVDGDGDEAIHVDEQMPIRIADPNIDLPLPQAAGGYDLPARYLPPGRLAHLLSLYMECSEGGHASVSTFSRCFRKMWRRAIVFRDHTTHSRCTVCALYSRQMSLCLKPEDKELVRAGQHAHVQGVLRDRAVYARVQRLCREACKPLVPPEAQSREDSVLSISIDGMDQANFKLICSCFSAITLSYSIWASFV